MIQTVSDLLEQFMTLEERKLRVLGIKHGPTIGAMYEGLTRSVLDLALPTDPILRVTSGFMRFESGELSSELDAMLVVGDGEPIPYTDKRIYPRSDVLAVIEVKKSLYQAGLVDGQRSLGGIVRLNRPDTPDVLEAVISSFQGVTRTPVPSDISELPLPLQSVWRALVISRLNPLRILLGYEGYKSEEAFRQGMARYLEGLVGVPGGSPMHLPDVIINNHIAAVKNIGAPWYSPMKDGWWPLIGTSDSQPLGFVLLEAIWTRLSERGWSVDHLFGEDLEIEVWHGLFDVRHHHGRGWEYRCWDHFPVRTLRGKRKHWEPAVVSPDAFVVAMLLGRNEVPNVGTSDMPRDRLEPALAELYEAGIAARDSSNPNIVRLLTEQCEGVVMPDGRFVLAENKSGRLLRWLEKNTQATDSKADSP